MLPPLWQWFSAWLLLLAENSIEELNEVLRPRRLRIRRLETHESQCQIFLEFCREELVCLEKERVYSDEDADACTYDT
jgi:hypothetical protein